LLQGTSLDKFTTASGSYTSLTSAPTAFQNYGSVAWLNDALWAITGGTTGSSVVIRYDIPTNTWTTPLTGLTTPYASQTTHDDSGNLWGYQSLSVIQAYSVASSILTTYTLPTPLADSEPRIAFDSCSGLLYVTAYSDTNMYSYNPSTGVQTLLAAVPAVDYEDGFCADRSGHLFVIANGTTSYQYNISTNTWTAMPSTGPDGSYNTACGVGADGYLYATEPTGPIYRIQLN
jgi:hypothetical protein